MELVHEELLDDGRLHRVYACGSETWTEPERRTDGLAQAREAVAAATTVAALRAALLQALDTLSQ